MEFRKNLTDPYEKKRLKLFEFNNLFIKFQLMKHYFLMKMNGGFFP